ncbi:MAG: hypothetical protein REI78_05255 [Pedobacter sp.]|nr:hypothetical protein [Pedobacter sp.]MDQ8052407.1 hypothetical protein [Pedobacter sp.]
MEKGEVIAFNKAAGKGFILNPYNKLYYLFQYSDCIDPINVGDNVIFEPYQANGAINIKRYQQAKAS